MNNRQLAENWYNQIKDSQSASNMYYNDKTIYSYGSHFPMAYLTGLTYGNDSKIILFNSDSYSNSTAKHLNYTHSQCYHDELIEIPTDILKDFINEFENGSPRYNTIVKAREALLKRIADYEAKKARARVKKATYQFYIDRYTRQLEILLSL